MSTRKVKPFARVLQVTSSSYATGETTLVTETHYLTTGDLVTVRFKNNPLSFTNVPVTVVNSTSFKITTDKDYQIKESGEVVINFYATGQTGGQQSITLTHGSGAPAVIQSFVKGTGGAVYTVEGSLDNVHWSPNSPITHVGTTDDTQASTIAPAWAWLRVNITSIGAATKLYINASA